MPATHSQPLPDRSATPVVARETGSVGTGGGAMLRGVLVRAGTFEAGGEMVDGVVINCRREDLAALPRLPLYEAVAVVPAAPVVPHQLPPVGSRFVDPQRVLGEAESWMQDVEMVAEEDRTEEESYALALWDELRRLRSIGRAAGPSGTEAIVCADITRRQAHGIAKYGTTVAANPLSLRQWLQHAYEESLDQSVYLRRAIAEIDAQNTPVTDAEPETPANTRAQSPRSV